MALTKAMLKAMELSDEKITQIIEAHRETINGLTEERDSLKEQITKLKADSDKLASVEKEMVKLQMKADSADENAKKLKALQGEFDAYKADMSAKETKASKEKAYRELLKEAGISEKRMDAIIRVTDLSELNLGDDGKFTDADKISDNIKTEWADFVVKESEKGADVPNPPSNTGGSLFARMNLRDKMIYANQNPDSAEVREWLK